MYSAQWRIQDLKEGGARSIACAKYLTTPQNVDHASHLHVLEDGWLHDKEAALGLVAMRKRYLRF